MAAEEFQRLLADVPDGEGDTGWSDFCHDLAPGVKTDPYDSFPPELYGMELPEPPPDLLARSYVHVATVQPTKPLPALPPQTAPPDGWWPHDETDIIEAWALGEIRDWLRAYQAWHVAGGPAHGRPQKLAFGSDAIKPAARGRLWDLRAGPGKVRLFDAETEPKRTCLNLDHAKKLFADCADQELLSMLLHGVQMKTDGLSHQIVLMPNLLSLYTSNGGVEAAAAQFADMTEQGFIGLFTGLPCCPFRAVPRGEVAKKGSTELRGVGDQGQPRNKLLTRKSREEVVPLNVECKRGEWSHQDMDNLHSAASNGAILQALADLNGEDTVEMAFDFSKYFWRLFLHVYSLWQFGCIVPRQGESEALDLALEYVMTMGATPSSQSAHAHPAGPAHCTCIARPGSRHPCNARHPRDARRTYTCPHTPRARTPPALTASGAPRRTQSRSASPTR